MGKQLMTPTEVIKYLGLSENTGYRYIQAIPFVPVGKRKRYTKADVDTWIASVKVRPEDLPAEKPKKRQPKPKPLRDPDLWEIGKDGKPRLKRAK